MHLRDGRIGHSKLTLAVNVSVTGCMLFVWPRKFECKYMHGWLDGWHANIRTGQEVKGKDYFLDCEITVHVLSSLKMFRPTQRPSLLSHIIYLVIWICPAVLCHSSFVSQKSHSLRMFPLLMTTISSYMQYAAVVMMPLQIICIKPSLPSALWVTRQNII